MRIWGELFGLVLFIACVVGLVFIGYFKTAPKPKKRIQPARWVPCDYTVDYETIVVVELRRPKSKDSQPYELLEKREVRRITNGALDYDKQYFNAMQDAADRASVLNALHN